MVMHAKDIVEADFIKMRRSETALHAAQVMKEKRRGFVVIVTEDGTPEGIVTEWDFLSRLVAKRKIASRTRLSELMSSNLVTVDADEGLDKVAEIMTKLGMRRMLVTKDGKVIGAITSKTILARLKEYADKIAAQAARLQTESS